MTPTEHIDLLSCPFCAGKAHLLEHPPHSHSFINFPDHPGSWTIECACGAGLIDENREAVVDRWNCRAHIAAATSAPPDDGWQPEDVRKFLHRWCKLLPNGFWKMQVMNQHIMMTDVELSSFIHALPAPQKDNGQ